MTPFPSLLGVPLRRWTTGMVLVAGLAAAPVPAPAQNRGSVAAATAVVSTTDRAIADAQRRLAKAPGDAVATKALAGAYLQKVREYADPTYYDKVSALLTSLGGVQSTDPEVVLLEGTLLLARHQFADALVAGRRAVAALPSSAPAHGILVDAYNELGRYDEALAATQAMVDLRPDLAALSRVSYARELRGDVPGAIEAMQQAVNAGTGTGEPSAYVQTLLGNLLLAHGNVSAASAVYASALRAYPGLVGARAGQAAVLAARGRPGEAAALMAKVVEAQPQLQFVIAEGDYYRAASMTKQANEADQLVDAIAALNRASGVNIDLELSLYDADHRPNAALVASTKRALAERPSTTGHHAMAWVLHRAGRDREASAEMAKVITVGDRDPVIRFHAAVIADAVGDVDEARRQIDLVLAGNPRASGINPVALTTLAGRLGRRIPAPR